MTDVTQLFVSPTSLIREAVARIDESSTGIALVVDSDRRLLGTITDGDVRRALLAGVGLEHSVQLLVNTKPEPAPRVPTTAPMGTAQAALLELMNRHSRCSLSTGTS